jgi:hypothetical protein
MVSESGSAKAEVASKNDTECLFRFDAALSEFHSKLIIVGDERASPRPDSNRSPDYLALLKSRNSSYAQSCVLADYFSTPENDRFIEFVARLDGASQQA